MLWKLAKFLMRLICKIGIALLAFVIWPPLGWVVVAMIFALNIRADWKETRHSYRNY